MTALLTYWLACTAVFYAGWCLCGWLSNREKARRAELGRNLANLVVECQRRVERFEVDGICLIPCIVTVFEAPLSTAEADRLQALAALAIVEQHMAVHFQRPAPRPAEA